MLPLWPIPCAPSLAFPSKLDSRSSIFTWIPPFCPLAPASVRSASVSAAATLGSASLCYWPTLPPGALFCVCDRHLGLCFCVCCIWAGLSYCPRLVCSAAPCRRHTGPLLLRCPLLVAGIAAGWPSVGWECGTRPHAPTPHGWPRMASHACGCGGVSCACIRLLWQLFGSSCICFASPAILLT